MAEQVFAERLVVLVDLDQPPLLEQVFVQCRCTSNHVGHRVVMPLSRLGDPVRGRSADLEQVVVRPLGSDLVQPFEPLTVSVLTVNDQFLLFDVGSGSDVFTVVVSMVTYIGTDLVTSVRFLSPGLLSRTLVTLNILQGDILLLLLFNPRLQFLSLHLQNLH